MQRKTALRIYEWLSYLLIVGATVVYFVYHEAGVNLVLLILLLAVFMRLMMERTRYKACDEENDELREDLRKLTRLLAEEKRKDKANG